MKSLLAMGLAVGVLYAGCSETKAPPEPESGANSTIESGSDVPLPRPDTSLDSETVAKTVNPATRQDAERVGAVLKSLEGDLLEREPQPGPAKVRHILLAWRSLSPAYGGRMNESAGKRDRHDAEALVFDILKQLEKGADFSSLVQTFGEDRSPLNLGKGYLVTPTSGFVPPFKAAAQRLASGESGVVETVYGWHILKREGNP